MALRRQTTGSLKPPGTPLQFDQICMSLLVSSCECPVCHTVVKPPSKMCLNGHLCCVACVLDESSCPECEERFSCARLSVVEQLLKIVGRACPHARHGCLMFLDSAGLVDHVPYCGWRKVQCLWCGAACGVNKWAKHVVEAHGPHALTYEAEGKIKVPLSTDDDKSQFYINGVMFCLFRASMENGPLYLTLQCYPTSKEDMETVFEAHIENKGLNFCQSIHPISDSVKQSDVFMNSDSCIIIPYYLWKQNDSFSFKITMPSGFNKDANSSNVPKIW